MRTIASLFAILIVTGCQAPMLWNKPGASQADFNSDKYQCMQASQQQTSSAYVNAYGGTASSGQSTNLPLFSACMNSKGWSLQKQTANNQQAEAATKALKEKAASVCADPKFAPYYSKTACGADGITFEQLADTSKISVTAKEIFPEVRAAAESLIRENMDIQRKYGGAAGDKRADLYTATAKVKNDRNNLDLYNGLITWGEYNKRRQDIYSEYLAAVRQIPS